MENQVTHALYGEIIFKFRVDQEGYEHRTWLLEKKNRLKGVYSTA